MESAVPGSLTISLDLELLWGVRDVEDRASYGANVLGGREAIPRMLELFERHGIRATWATVGFVFCADRDELFSVLAPPELRPRYSRPELSTYAYLDEVGSDEASDPHYFGASLVELIGKTPGQEIGTHTLSHFYCLEDGPTHAAFTADLESAIAVAARRGITLRSIVFPRNQYGPAHLAICERLGITAYRGNPAAWAYRPVKGSEQTPLRRALRLADAYTGILGSQLFQPEGGEFRNIPASQFLRPRAGRLARFHPLHLRRIMAAMTDAARKGLGFHLRWHPHNFGRNTGDNLAGLRRVLEHFERLRADYGMRSASMGEAVP